MKEMQSWDQTKAINTNVALPTDALCSSTDFYDSRNVSTEPDDLFLVLFCFFASRFFGLHDECVNNKFKFPAKLNDSF